MSLWSILGKVGAGVAAPFTGGLSLAAIPAIDALGQKGQQMQYDDPYGGIPQVDWLGGAGTNLPSHGLPDWLPPLTPGGTNPAQSGVGGDDWWKALLPGQGRGGGRGDASELIKLLPLLLKAFGNQGASPEMERIQQLTNQRMEAQNPLFEAASRLAFQRLPTQATQGLQLPTLNNSTQVG